MDTTTETNINDKYEEILALAMQLQPIVNIGMIGHVSNGKSTLTKCLTGTSTQKHTDELVRNITIKLGYANAKIFKCDNCEAPSCYQCRNSNVMEHFCTTCNEPTRLVMHTSHVDCPGHHDLMSVMLNGTAVMDYTILVESCANQTFPAPQTIEHFKITKTIGIEPVMSVLNKADLMVKQKDKLPQLMTDLRNFVGNTVPIVPISGTLGINVDVVCEYLANLKIPKKDLNEKFKMLVIRSFNVNHPGVKINQLKGGVLGGSITRGIMKVGDTALVYPGFTNMKVNENPTEEDIRWQYSPLKCKILSINSDKNSLNFAISGGLIGVQLDIDPGITCNDNLVGQVMFKESEDMNNVKVYEIIQISHKQMESDLTIKQNDKLVINVNSNKIGCQVIKKSSKYLNLLLDSPICVELGDKVTINVFVDVNGSQTQKIYGYGEILDGADCEKI